MSGPAELRWTWRCGGCYAEHVEKTDKAPKECPRCGSAVVDLSSLIAIGQDTGLTIPAQLEARRTRFKKCGACGVACLLEESFCSSCGSQRFE